MGESSRRRGASMGAGTRNIRFLAAHLLSTDRILTAVSVVWLTLQVPSVTYAAPDPDPSPLFKQSLAASVRGLERPEDTVPVGRDSRVWQQPAPALVMEGQDGDTCVCCVYELICASGDPDTLAALGFEVGMLRRGLNCNSDYYDCVRHWEVRLGSVCLVWQYLECALTDLPRIPLGEPSGFCNDSLCTMPGMATCNAATCRNSTCAGGISCPGYWMPTMGCATETCSPNVTCYGNTCSPAPTCYPACPTSTGGATCALTTTCGSSATCVPAPTCTGPTCFPNATCPGVSTCPMCVCSHQGDLNDDGVIDTADVRNFVHYLYSDGSPPPADSTCPLHTRGDLDCDGQETIVDIVILACHVHFAYPALCNPCTDRNVLNTRH
jgi:hypothetical protein